MVVIQETSVLDCVMGECAYNLNKKCHAKAITIGRKQPRCDTFMKSPEKGGVPELIGTVGACKVKECMFNKSFECSAEGIHVTEHGHQALCNTYKKES